MSEETTELMGMKIDELNDELAALRQQLAEARADRDNFQCQLKAFNNLHWELVDLFDEDAGGVSPLHYVKERIAAQAAELERLRAHNDSLVREHKEMAVEVTGLHVEIENVRYAADVGLTEEANRADRWIGHARRLFKLKCEYSQKCREKDAELATLRERLAECDTYHAPRIAELERLNKEQFDRFSDLLSVLGNINQCRTAEGDSIEILCDNPEAWSVDKQAAVEASGAYTDYEPTKFFGSTWQEALQKAADCARRYYSG